MSIGRFFTSQDRIKSHSVGANGFAQNRSNLVNNEKVNVMDAVVQHDTLHFSPWTQNAARFVRPTSVVINSALLRDGHDLGYQSLKRALDFSLASIASLLLMPVFAIIAILIAVNDRGPVFFRQDRLGARGKVFRCLKFRTMVTNAEKLLQEDASLMQRFASDFKIKDDPRITPIGAFLRKSSLDELPQLFNILTGDMSFIGPRPIIVPEIEKYGAYGAKLLSVKPGLGGIWQACGRSEISYEERIALDMIYIENCSIRTDLQLMFMTVASVMRKNGAY